MDVDPVVETPDDDVTLIAMSVTHAAPPEPQDFTCKMWEPVDEEMLLLSVWPCTTVVSLLLSNDHPIAFTLFEEQVDEEAERVNGDETLVLFDGLFTVTPARAGSESVKTAEDVMIRFLNFIEFPLRFEGTDFADSPLAFLQAQVELSIQL